MLRCCTTWVHPPQESTSNPAARLDNSPPGGSREGLCKPLVHHGPEEAGDALLPRVRISVSQVRHHEPEAAGKDKAERLKSQAGCLLVVLLLLVVVETLQCCSCDAAHDGRQLRQRWRQGLTQ